MIRNKNILYAIAFLGGIIFISSAVMPESQDEATLPCPEKEKSVQA